MRADWITKVLQTERRDWLSSTCYFRLEFLCRASSYISVLGSQTSHRQTTASFVPTRLRVVLVTFNTTHCNNWGMGGVAALWKCPIMTSHCNSQRLGLLSSVDSLICKLTSWDFLSTLHWVLYEMVGVGVGWKWNEINRHSRGVLVATNSMEHWTLTPSIARFPWFNQIPVSLLSLEVVSFNWRNACFLYFARGLFLGVHWLLDFINFIAEFWCIGVTSQRIAQAIWTCVLSKYTSSTLGNVLDKHKLEVGGVGRSKCGVDVSIHVVLE